MRSKVMLIGGFALVVTAAAVGLVVVHGYRNANASPSAAPAPVTLPQALSVSKRLGPVAPRTPVHLVVALRSERQQLLRRLFLSGEGGSAQDAKTLLSPNAALVEKALAVARRAGFATQWSRGDSVASLTGPAASVVRLLGVHLTRYVAPGGQDFYAGNRNPVLPMSFRTVVTGIAGLDDFEQMKPARITPGGATPDDMIGFYDLKPLRAAGLDGAGQTIVFPEAINPGQFAQLQRDLATYSAKFGLPPADISFRANQSWGPFASGSRAADDIGEADLDVEVAHGIAPGAKLIVYALGNNAGWITAEDAMVNENPTAVVSLSYGSCELPYLQNPNLLNASEQPWLRLAAQNMAAFVSTGDSGGYGCGQTVSPSAGFPASVPSVVGVGGTTVFFAASGGYGHEIAWGEALTQWGSGGGVSKIYARPPWQKGAGWPSTASVPGRLQPDVSAMAFEGWNILGAQGSGAVGGTSASAPFWAAMTAVIDEYLQKSGVRRIGVPNQGLAWIAAHQSSYGAFHDVTQGNNLVYDAGRGWDAATGFGTPDAARMALAWKAYFKAGGK